MWPKIKFWQPNSSRSKYVLFDDDDDYYHHGGGGGSRNGGNNQNHHDDNKSIEIDNGRKSSYKSMADKLEYFHQYYQSFDSSIEDVQTNHVYHTISAASTAPTAAKITDNFSSLPAVQILNDDGNRQQQQQRSSESTTFGKNSEIFTTTTSVSNMIATKTNSKLNESLPIMVAACNEKRKQHRATIDLKCSKFIIFTMIMLFLLLFTFILFISYRLIYYNF